MSKKKSQSQQTNISPENFIRLSSRELPVHGCWIAEGWQFSKLATSVIARKHPSGNISFCIYLVDLACLGVKDSWFKYNELPENFNKIISAMKDNIFIQPASYELVHNVIHSAVSFAGKYGFKPNITFEFVTQYFLEEDSDEIPKMEITCGDTNGKPVYIYMGYENPERALQIQKHLEKISRGNSNNFSMMEDEDSIFGPSILDDIFSADHEDEMSEFFK